jgi:hypothetical protein
MIGAKKVMMWIWKLINMEGKNLHVVGLHAGLETSGWKNKVFFFFLGF